MENIKQKCEIHQKEIIYICFTSVWHCEALCAECLVPHNKLHVKNATIPKIEEYEMFLKQFIENMELKKKQYSNILEEIENFLQLPDEEIFSSNSTLQEFAQIKLQIFQDLEKKLQCMEKIIKNHILLSLEKNKTAISQHKINFLSLKKDIESHIESLNNPSENKKIIETIKFGSNFLSKNENEKTFEEYKSLIKIDLTKDIRFDTGYFREIVDNFDDFLKINSEEQKILPKKPNKNKENFKTFKKICKKCGNEMEYVSDFKKHIVCSKCNSVKRLYEKKL